MVKLHRPQPTEKGKHFIMRAFERGLDDNDLIKVKKWSETNPDVFEGDWFAKFSDFTIAGTGPVISTTLKKKMKPSGQEIIIPKLLR